MTNAEGSRRSFEDLLFDDGDLAGSRLLGAAYSRQVAYFLPFELPAYYSSPRWLQAKTVLDVGTGNGGYLHAIASAFPGKTYHGIDVAPHLIADARNSGSRSNVTFACRDLFAEGGTYDALIVRFVLQHLPDVRLALRKCFELTRPGGIAIFIDGLDQRMLYLPPLPAYQRLLDELREQRRATGVSAEVMDGFVECVQDTPWMVGDRLDQIAPTSVPGNKALLKLMQDAIVDYLAHTGLFRADFGRIREEWQGWHADADSYGQECLRIVRLEKPAGGTTDPPKGDASA